MSAWKKRGDTGKGGDNYGCLPKYNYGTGAGWRTKKQGRIQWGIKRKK